MQALLVFILMLLAFRAPAAERVFDFSQTPAGRMPGGFQSLVAGTGAPGDWKIEMEDVPPLLKPLSPQAPSVARRAVLAQVAREPDSGHFPMLVFGGGTYGDFRLTTRFKIVGGGLAQMAGIVFHFQNTSNFYLVYASALGDGFRCTKMVNGQWKPPLGKAGDIAPGVWHNLSVECDGTRITCLLDGGDAIKLIDASDNRPGKIGFCTRADAVCYFADTTITYTPQQIPAQALVRRTLEEFPRLIGLKIYMIKPGATEPTVIASNAKDDLGQAGGKAERDVIRNGTMYFSRERHSISVTEPLNNRNGDPIAAVRITMKTFPGQTEDNALARAMPVMRRMQSRVLSREDLEP